MTPPEASTVTTACSVDVIESTRPDRRSTRPDRREICHALNNAPPDAIARQHRLYGHGSAVTVTSQAVAGSASAGASVPTADSTAATTSPYSTMSIAS